MAEIEPTDALSEDIGPTIASTLASQRRAETLTRIRAQATSAAETFVPKAPTTSPSPTPAPAAAAPTEETGEEGSGGIKLPGVKAVARGLAGGFAETPEAIFNGVREAVADNIATLNDFDMAAAQKMREAGIEQDMSTFADISRQAAIGFLAGFQENEEKTIIGNFVRDVANFATDFFPISRVIRNSKAVAALGKAAGPTAANITSNVIAGAIADFATIDTADRDLQELVREYPILSNPVTEYLAGDDQDTALDTRTKSAFLGAGLGAVADTLFVSLRAMRSGVRTQVQLKRAKAAALEAEGKTGEIPTIEGPTTTPEQASVSGFGDDEALIRTPAAKTADAIEKAEAELLERFPDMDPDELRAQASALDTDVEINFDRIDTTEDVEKLMQDATNLFSESVDKARRGKISNVETQAQADALDIGIDEVLTRQVGTTLNAAQTTAYRRIWVSAAEKVEELARIAQFSKNDVDIFRFRKGQAVFNAINQSVLGARAEAARSFQSWRITVKGDAERAAVIGQLVESNGRSKVGADMADQFLKAIDAGHSPGQINQLVARGFAARTLDAVRESAVLGLLWNPSTHAANITSNAIRQGMAITERGIAARIGREMLTEDGVALGEAAAQFRGTIGAIKMLWASGAEAEKLKAAASSSVAGSGSKIDVPMNATSAAWFGLDESHGLGKAIETIGNVITTPARFLTAADDLFKSVAYAGEVEAQAFRQATREGSLQGWDEPRVAERIVELTSNPPEHIRFESGQAALSLTFQNSTGDQTKKFMELRNSIPGMAYIFPFVKTPANVFRYSFESSPLAPLVGQWRADVAKGGAARDIALGRMALGTTVAAVMVDWAWEGHIQGAMSEKSGVREAMLRQGLQEDSMRIGGVTVRLNRLDPFGLPLSMAGSIVGILKTHDVEEDDTEEVSRIMAAIAASFASAITGRSMLTATSQLIDAMREPDTRGPRFVQQRLQMLVPLSSALRSATKVTNPARPDVADLGDALLAMVPFLESRLNRSRNIYGETIERDIIDIANPFTIRKVELNPSDQAIVDNRVNLQRIHRKTTFAGAQVDFRMYKDVYSTYAILAGHELKIRGRGMKEALTSLVESRRFQTWSSGPDGRRALEMQRVVRQYREAAQRDIMRDPRRIHQTDEFDRFRNYVNRKVNERRQGLRPSSGNID